MRGDDEMLQIEQVIARLSTRYPTVPAGDIETTVRIIHQRFVHGKVRDFVPLLVEKAARRQITESDSPWAARTALPPAG
ncbi:three-helix bundle dimerization domain-containing protein [Rhodococcus chondri]|uniref:Uncharacterized protein n=1 Tax=Rhodococcus chondri TaxID=3065941 RepID=A0ABU7JYA5_9NOCA|nr:hypothetical protein [Rhodococcus sp. CC-R104]MEE2034991.1 hypothetical protein [Rhodococcus sp. CC-R104]